MYQYGNVAVKYRREKRRMPRATYHTYALSPKRTTQRNATPRPAVKDVSRPAALPRKSRFTAMEKISCLMAVLLVAVSLCLLMAQSASISQTNYDIQRLEAERAAILSENVHLEQEVLMLSTPERILEIAQQELGMQAEASKVRILTHTSR